MKAAFAPHKIHRPAFRALKDSVIIYDMSFDERLTNGGIVLLNDNGKSSGIRARWGKVYAVGPEQKHVRTGQWILVAHGRWTRGMDIEDDEGTKTIRKIDPNDILCVSDEEPQGIDTISDAMSA